MILHFFKKIAKFYAHEIMIALLTVKFNSASFHFLQFAESYPMTQMTG